MQEKSFKEFLNTCTPMRWLIVAFVFSILVSSGAVWWGYYQGQVADKHICAFADASRRSQISTAGDAARALLQIAADGNFKDVGTPEADRPHILDQLNKYVRGDLKEVPEGLHPQIAELFVVGKQYVNDAEARVRTRLPEVGTFVPLCKGVEINEGDTSIPITTGFLTPPVGLLANK
jgi:hypothetical protein